MKGLPQGLVVLLIWLGILYRKFLCALIIYSHQAHLRTNLSACSASLLACVLIRLMAIHLTDGRPVHVESSRVKWKKTQSERGPP